ALGVGDRLVIAGGLSSPLVGVRKLDAAAPSRYAGVDWDASRIVAVTVGAAYRLGDRVRVGATVQDVVSQVHTQIVVSGCPGTMTCAPEDPSFDALLAIDQTDYVSPSGSLGVQVDAAPNVTLGLAAQAPARVSGEGTLSLKLPASPVFQDAKVLGNRGRIAFTLPPTVHAGVEWRTRALRIEAALAVELWSFHDDVTLTPVGVSVMGMAGAPIPVHAVTIPRGDHASYAPAIGVEWHGPQLTLG